MPKKININIVEDLAYLKKLHSGCSTELVRDRLKMLLCIKQEKYGSRKDIAIKLGRRPTTIGLWVVLYQEKGLSGLVEVQSGGNNTKMITQEAKAFIANKVLDQHTTITSYVELQAMLAQELNQQVTYAALYAHCRRKHKTKLKVSRKSHYKKDDKAEEVFKKP
ncbi:helix-turn-helix domain-containing protein [Aquimarina longa]|uniref:helix-turn-helix domain-containing protein n=1 Tax=Aquimarina longa TaxID=1080221 RepID=UPI000782BC40|nr:helix-turn-helix domain-containing protein [Aquimarina longa]